MLQVAEFTLRDRDPQALAVARNILLDYAEFFPRDSTFVGSAAWADNLHSGARRRRRWPRAPHAIATARD